MVSRMHDDGCGFLFVFYERLFSMGFFNWDHADCPLSGIKKRLLMGGFLYTSTIVNSIGAIASVLCIEVVCWWEGPLWEVPLYTNILQYNIIRELKIKHKHTVCSLSSPLSTHRTYV